jgi:hypothetical protein
MSDAQPAFGSELSFGDAQGGPYSVVVKEVRDYATPDIVNELLDVTPHVPGTTTGFAHYIGSAVSDPPEISFVANYDHDDASHEHAATGLLYLALQKLKKHWQVKLPTTFGSRKWQFAGIVTKAGVKLPVKGEATLEFTIKPTDYMTIT